MFNLYNAILVAALLLLVGLEFWRPARHWKPAKGWYLRSTLSAVIYLVIASYAPFLWDQWLGHTRLIDATQWPLALAIPVGYVIYQLALYVWHRALHRSDFLWRYLHQMHHSAERMEAIGALYFHPIDLLAFVFVGSVALTLGIGLSPLAAAVIGVAGGIISIFTHTNIRTPRWAGFLIARPEMHGLHHTRGRHAGNYGEIALWDMVFKTYENPETWNKEVGFYDGASARVFEMLLGIDVSTPANSTTCTKDEAALEPEKGDEEETTRMPATTTAFSIGHFILILALGTNIGLGMVAALSRIV